MIFKLLIFELFFATLGSGRHKVAGLAILFDIPGLRTQIIRNFEKSLLKLVLYLKREQYL